MSDTDGVIVNKVQQSDKLVTVDLQKYYDPVEVMELDLEPFLFKGLLLKEEPFRQALEEHDWEQYRDACLAVFCSSDAIISRWAYMLVAAHASGIARDIIAGTRTDMRNELWRRKLDSVDWEQYSGKFVILKGCSSKDRPVPESAYLHAARKLVPHVKKLMYGEACSNVPVYRG